MSDGFALAALSYAVRSRMQQFIDKEIDAASAGTFDIVTRAPEQLASAGAAKVTITVYPWKVVPNVAWLTSRRHPYGPTGTRRESPLLAIDVYYIVAGYAPPAGDADLLMGWALLALHETPTVTRELLLSLADTVGPATFPLRQALRDLAEQPAPLKVEPVTYELEELSQVWSTLNSGARTGMIYRVGTLLMESRYRGAAAPPVREVRLSVLQLRAPQIARMLLAAAGGNQFTERNVASPGEALRIEGSGLKGEVTHVALGDVLVSPNLARLRPDQVEIDVPPDLRPGVVPVQVRHDWPKPPAKLPPPALGTIPGESSNQLPLVIRPMLRAGDPLTLDNRRTDSNDVVSFDVTAHFAVRVGNRQRTELLLNATVADADGRYVSFTFPAKSPAPDAPEAAVLEREAVISGVPNGTYLARVVVDGAESALLQNEAGIAGPFLVVPP